MPTIEDVMNYWNARPCNVRHSSHPQDSLQYSREVTKKKYFVEPHIRELACFNAWHGRSVLDVGCGIGTDSIEFAKGGAKVTAIDVSLTSVHIALRRSIVEQLDSDSFLDIQFSEANAELSLARDRIPGWPFDLIYSFGALHHTPTPELALRNLARILKRDGQLRIMLYNRWSTKALGIVLNILIPLSLRDPRSFDQIVAERSEAEPGCPITHTYSRKSARELLDRAGFRVRKMYVEHIFPYDGEKYGQGLYVKKWYWRICPAWLFRKLERTLGWHLCIIAELK